MRYRRDELPSYTYGTVAFEVQVRNGATGEWESRGVWDAWEASRGHNDIVRLGQATPENVRQVRRDDVARPGNGGRIWIGPRC